MKKRIILILGMVIIGLTACGGNETVNNSNTVEVMKNIEMESSEVEESSHNVDESNSNADNGDISTDQQRDNEQSLTDNVSVDVQGQNAMTAIDTNDGEYIVSEEESETIPTEEQSESVVEQPKEEQPQQQVVEQPKAEQTQQVVEQPQVEQSQPQQVVEQPNNNDDDHVGFDGVNPATGEVWKEGDVMSSGFIYNGDNTAEMDAIFNRKWNN